MAEDLDPNTAKKRRIIHWNPDAGREQVSRRWTWKRVLAWSVGGLVGLLLAGRITVEVSKLLFGPDVFSPRVATTAPGQTVSDAKTAFMSQAKAEQLHLTR